MTYYMPTRVFEEDNAVLNHAEDICRLAGSGTAVIVTGHSSSRKNGSLYDVLSALAEGNKPYVIFDEVEANPSVENVIAACNKVMAGGSEPGAVIGLGGGSPMDAAKAISLLLYNRASVDMNDVAAVTDFLYSRKTGDSCYPVIAVPTTCGTGSEVTAISVITRHDKGTKGSIAYRIFPELALIDAKYVMNTPSDIICNTSIDAFCHLAESFINSKATDYSRMCVSAGLRIWAKCKGNLLDIACGEKPTQDAASLLMRASAFAGMAIAQTGTSIPHGLSYKLTYEMNVPHGKAAGQFAARYIAEADDEDRNEVLALAGFETADEVYDFIADVCGIVELSDGMKDQLVRSMLANPAKMAAAPFEVNEDVLRRLIP